MCTCLSRPYRKPSCYINKVLTSLQAFYTVGPFILSYHKHIITFDYFYLYRYIGRQNASRVGHLLDDLIISCHMYVVDGISKKKVPCKDNVRFLSFQTAQYFRCINIQIAPVGETVVPVMGISLVLFLDNFEEDPGEEFNPLDDSGHSSGVTLGIYQRNSIPALTLNTMEVPSGQKVNIRVTPERRSRLPPPHGNCNEGIKPYLAGVDMVELNFSYTFPSCLHTCLESRVKDQCKCISGKNVDVGEYQDISVDYCGNLRAGWKQAMQTRQCRNNIHDQSLKHCIQSCPVTCTDYRYKLGMSHSVWPRRSRMMSFYKHFIKDKPYAHQFSVFEEILNDNQSRPLKNTKFLYAADLIRSNFVDLTVSLKDYKYIALRDTPKVSFEGLISQLGGTLNLWSGISAIIAIEIIEFIYRLILSLCSSNKKEASIELDKVQKVNLENGTEKV